MARKKPKQQIEQSWQLPIDENGTVELPQEFLDRTGWQEGDEIEFEQEDSGAWILRRRDPDLISRIEPVPSRAPITDGSRITLTVLQIQRLAELTRDLDDSEPVEIHVDHTSGIGPTVSARFSQEVDITDYDLW